VPVADALAESCALVAQSVLADAPVHADPRLLAQQLAAKLAARSDEYAVEVDLMAASALSTSSTGQNRRPQRGRVLAVNDDVAAITTIEALLEDEFEVLSASNVAQAATLLKSMAPDVIVTDHRMPDGTGLELLDRARAMHPGIVGMLITGHHEYPDVIAARADERIYRVLLKPYQPEALQNAVRGAVSVSNMRRATARLGGGERP